MNFVGKMVVFFSVKEVSTYTNHCSVKDLSKINVDK
jgi:hypothetical protein